MKINLQSKKSFIDQKIRDYSSSTKTLIGRSSIDHEEKFDIWRSEVDGLIKIDQMKWIKLKPWLIVSWIRWKFCETLILTCRSHTRLILLWTVKDEMMKMWGGILGQKLGYDRNPVTLLWELLMVLSEQCLESSFCLLKSVPRLLIPLSLSWTSVQLTLAYLDALGYMGQTLLPLPYIRS